jgi:hypothetical protein
MIATVATLVDDVNSEETGRADTPGKPLCKALLVTAILEANKPERANWQIVEYSSLWITDRKG